MLRGVPPPSLGTATAGSNATFTANTAGFSLDGRGYAGTGTTFGGTNVSGSFTLNSNGLQASLSAASGAAALTLSDNATSGTAGRLAFTNLNGVTLSLSTGAGGSHTVVGSHNALTSQSNQNVTAANGGFAFQTLSFSNANGISFGTSAGSAITGSHNGLTSQSNQAFSADGGSSAFQTLSFSNQNGLSWTNTNGQVGVTHALQFTSNTSAITSNALNTSASRVSGVVAASNNTGGGTATLTGGVSFTNANGLTFYTSAGNAIAGSYTVPTVTNSSLTMQAGASTLSSVSRVAFVDSNGVSFGASTSNNGSITVTATVRTDWLSTQSNQALSGSNGSFTFQTATFGNLNGMSFYTSNGSLVGSYTVPTVPAQMSGGLSTGGNTSGDTGVVTGRLVLAGGNNITVSGSTNGGSMTVTISGPNIGGAQTGISGIVVSDTTYTSGTVTFQNANGMSFGSSGANGISASYTVPTVTNSSWTVSDAITSLSVARLAFTNANGLTLSLSTTTGGIATVVGSYTVPSTAGLISAVNVSAGTTSGNLSAFTLANSGGVSFGLNAGTVTATVATSYRASNDAVGLNTALTAGPLAWTVNSSGISLNASSAAGTTSGFAGNLISGSMTHNTAGLNLSLNHPAWLTTAMQSNAATISNVNISAGTTSTNASAFTLADANGVSFGLGTGASAGSITASHNALTSQSNQNVTAANGGFAFQTLSFSNANGISFGTSAGSAITASHNALTTARASNDAIGLNTAQTNVTWTVNSSGLSLNAAGYAGTGTSNTGAASFTLNSNGLAFNGTSLAGVGTTFNGTNVSGSMTLNTAGLRLDLSANVGGGGMGISAGTQSVSTGTMIFANSNGLTFGMSGSSQITASYNSTQFAGTGTTFAGANISASMTLNSNGLNLSASVAAPGAAAEQNAINLLGANTSGNTTATGSTIGWSGINLTLSGTNVSQVVVSAPATSSLSATGLLSISTNGSTISMGVSALTLNSFCPMQEGSTNSQTFGALGVTSASAFFFPFTINNYFAGNCIRLLQRLSIQTTSNSSGLQTLSSSWGLYTNNASTLSQISSGSCSYAYTGSSVSGSLSFVGTTATGGATYTSSSASTTAQGHSFWGTAGNRIMDLTFGNTFSLTPGAYWLGLMRRASSSNANLGISDAFAGNVVAAQVNAGPIGMGTTSGTTNFARRALMGFGVYTSTGSAGYGGTALPASAFLSGIAHTATVYPLFTLASTN